jgi:small-conductance mechanosensitive channel
MRDKFRLFIVVGKAALITTAGCLVPLLTLKLALTRSEQGTLTLIAIILATGIATWWIFRKLQTGYTRREARAMATTFAILAPVSLAIAMLLSLIPGGYAEMLLGSHFAPVGAFAGIIAMTTILDSLLCLLTLWMTRRIIKLESAHS